MYPLNTPNRKEDIIVNTNISLKDNNIEQEIKNALSGFDIINKERKTYDFLLHDSAFRNLLKIETNDGFVKDMFATTFRTLGLEGLNIIYHLGLTPSPYCSRELGLSYYSADRKIRLSDHRYRRSDANRQYELSEEMKKIVNDDNSILAIEYNNIWMPIMTIPRYRYKRETETNSNSNKNLIKHLTKKIKHLHATLQQNIDSKKYDLYDIYKTLHKNNTGMSSQERGQLGNIIGRTITTTYKELYSFFDEGEGGFFKHYQKLNPEKSFDLQKILEENMLSYQELQQVEYIAYKHGVSVL